MKETPVKKMPVKEMPAKRRNRHGSSRFAPFRRISALHSQSQLTRHSPNRMDRADTSEKHCGTDYPDFVTSGINTSMSTR